MTTNRTQVFGPPNSHVIILFGTQTYSDSQCTPWASIKKIKIKQTYKYKHKDKYKDRPKKRQRSYCFRRRFRDEDCWDVVATGVGASAVVRNLLKSTVVNSHGCSEPMRKQGGEGISLAGTSTSIPPSSPP